MRKLLSLSLLGATIGVAMSAQAAPLVVDNSQQNALAITLYNQDLGLIRDVRNLPPINNNQTLYIEDVSHQIMSETLQLENAGKVLEQNLNNNLISGYALLQAYIGKQLQLARFNSVSGTETVSNARLLSVQGDQAIVKHQNRIETVPVNQQGWRFIFPSIPEGMQSRPSLEIRSEGTKKAGEAVLTYLTRGLSWQMDYAIVLDKSGEHVSLDGLATLRNQTGVDYPDAKILLMAGQINQPPAMLRQRTEMVMAMADAAPKSGAPEAFQDYQLYRLPQTASLLNGQTKQVSLIGTERVKANKTYHYDFPVYASLDQHLYDQKPDIKVSFNNVQTDGLGFPLPAGTARVFSPDKQGLRHFIGSAQIQHTAKGQQVELPIGKAFDLTIKRRQARFDKVYNGHQVSQELELKSSRDQDSLVTIAANFGQPWEIKTTNHDFSKASASRAEWTVKVPANGTATLHFTATLNKL